MRDYPPEYDEPQATELKVNGKPDWIEAFYHSEDGDILLSYKGASCAEQQYETISKGVEEEEDAEEFVATWLAEYNAAQASMVERLKKATAYVKNRPVDQTWEEHWMFIEKTVEGMEKGRFQRPDRIYFDSSEAGDWRPVWDEDRQTYGKEAVAFAWGRDEDGNLYIRASNVDQYGDWETERWYEDDWETLYREMMDTNEHFLAWANYFQWCHANGAIDPLEEFIKGVPTLKQCVNAFEDNIRFIEDDVEQLPQIGKDVIVGLRVRVDGEFDEKLRSLEALPDYLRDAIQRFNARPLEQILRDDEL